MKKSISLISATILLSTALLATTASALPEFVKLQRIASTDNARLELEITKLEAAKGQIVIALFDSKDGYNNDETYREKIENVTSETLQINFPNISAGEYAFKLYHDINGDGTLNTDMLGIPKEPYYFSTNASDPFSAPEWEEAKFLLPSGKMMRKIELD